MLREAGAVEGGAVLRAGVGAVEAAFHGDAEDGVVKVKVVEAKHAVQHELAPAIR